MRKPVHSLPMMPAPPRTDKARAAACAVTPCSVEHGGKIGDEAVFAKRGKHDDEARIQNGAVRNAAPTVVPDIRLSSSLRRGAGCDQQRSERESQQGDAAEHKVGVAPAMMFDNPLRDRRNQNGADSAARKDQGKRKPRRLLEPGKDGAGVGELRSPVGNEAKMK